MQNQQIEDLTRIIVEEILKSLGPSRESAPCQKATGPNPVAGGDLFCLFYEMPSGLQEVGEQLKYLQNQGVRLGCMESPLELPPSFSNISWRDRLPSGTFPANILDRYKSYLIANLSRRALAELATGVTAWPMSELIYRALGRRSRVIAVRDPLIPNRVECSWDPIKLSPVQNAIEEGLEKIKELGIEVIQSENVMEALSQTPQSSNQAEGAYRGFVTLEDLEGFDQNQIRLLRGTKTTPLVDEWLRDKGIEVRWIDP